MTIDDNRIRDPYIAMGACRGRHPGEAIGCGQPFEQSCVAAPRPRRDARRDARHPDFPPARFRGCSRGPVTAAPPRADRPRPASPAAADASAVRRRPRACPRERTRRGGPARAAARAFDSRPRAKARPGRQPAARDDRSGRTRRRSPATSARAGADRRCARTGSRRTADRPAVPAIGRGRLDVHRRRVGDALPHALDPRAHPFAGNDAGHEHDKPVRARNHSAAGGRLVDRERTPYRQPRAWGSQSPQRPLGPQR